MKSVIFILTTCFIFLQCFSQSRTRIYGDLDDFHVDSLIKQQQIKKERIYQYHKKEKNKDSVLVLINFFNDEGLLIETDKFNKDGSAVSITNFEYIDNKLVKLESISKNEFEINNSFETYEVKTYDYDSAGNKSVEKTYNKSNGSSFRLEEETKWMYDENGRIIKVYDGPGDSIYLHHEYVYYNNKISEVNSYDRKGKWFYSYIHKYDDSNHTESIFLKNVDETLESQYFYNNKNELIEELSYPAKTLVAGFNLYSTYKDHSTKYFEYTNQLLSSERMQLTNGENVYYKYYYEK